MAETAEAGRGARPLTYLTASAVSAAKARGASVRRRTRRCIWTLDPSTARVEWPADRAPSRRQACGVERPWGSRVARRAGHVRRAWRGRRGGGCGRIARVLACWAGRRARAGGGLLAGCWRAAGGLLAGCSRAALRALGLLLRTAAADCCRGHLRTRRLALIITLHTVCGVAMA